MAHRERPATCHVGGEELGPAILSSDPDLIALRDAAAREKHAFMEYRRFGRATADATLACLFREEGRHEAGHFIELCQMMSRIDPIQASEFRDHGVGFLAGEPPEMPDGDPHGHESRVKDPEEWLAYLKEAVDLELHTLNFYQDEAKRACHPEVKELLTRIMNHEKEDLAIFIRELYRLLHRHGH